MPKLTLAAAALLAVLPLARVEAAPLVGKELELRASGGQFRGYGTTRRHSLEDIIWRLESDGTVRSVSQIVRKYGGGMGMHQMLEYSDAGSWRIQGGRLCVEFRSVHADLNGCYAVESGGGDHVRLAGPVLLRGTLAR